MEYHMAPLLETFFTKSKENELLNELQSHPNGGPVFEEFLRYYTAKSIDEDEITQEVSTRLNSFACALIDMENESILKRLLENNASFATVSSGFRELCPLCYAIYKKKNSMATAMIDALPLEEIDDIDSTSPGSVAIGENNRDIITALLKKGCNTAKFAGNYSALQLAVLRLNDDLVRLLLDYNVDVNEVGRYNKYPALALAVQQDDFVIVQLLLECSGLKINLMDEKGLRPIDYARSEKMKHLLQSAGAKETPEYAKKLCEAVLALHEENEEDPLQLTKELVVLPDASASYESFDLLYDAVIGDEYEIAKLLLEHKLVSLPEYKKDLVRAVFYGGIYEGYDRPKIIEQAKQIEKLLNLLLDYDYRYPFSSTDPKTKYVRHLVQYSLNVLPSDHYLKPVLSDLLGQMGFDVSEP